MAHDNARAAELCPFQPMATAKAVEYFGRYASDYGYEYEVPLLVETFTAPQGWRGHTRPYPALTPALVQELAGAGVQVVMVSAYARHADFRIVPAGLISPAYLT
jgi:hypothetical protein